MGPHGTPQKWCLATHPIPAWTDQHPPRPGLVSHPCPLSGLSQGHSGSLHCLPFPQSDNQGLTSNHCNISWVFNMHLCTEKAPPSTDMVFVAHVHICGCHTFRTDASKRKEWEMRQNACHRLMYWAPHWTIIRKSESCAQILGLGHSVSDAPRDACEDTSPCRWQHLICTVLLLLNIKWRIVWQRKEFQ